MIGYILPFFFLATGVIANKLSLAYIAPGISVGIRMLVSGIILLTCALYTDWQNFWPKFKKYWIWLAILASFATFIPAILKAYALKHTYSSKVALIGGLDPFLTALYSYILLHEPLSRKKWMGILLGFAGTCVLVIGHACESCTVLFGTIGLAELAALGTAIISRYGWIKVQQLLKAHIFTVREINGATMFFAGFYSLVSTAIFMPSAFNVTWSWTLIGLLAYTIVGGNLIGYQLYSHMLKKYTATFVSIAGFSMPIFVYALGWLVIGESLYPSFFIAGALTFCGVLVFYQDELRTIGVKK